MGRAQFATTMNVTTFFGLFLYLSLSVGPTLSFQCHTCVGGVGGVECDDANPGKPTTCPLTDHCILSIADTNEARSCGVGNLASSGLTEECTEETLGDEKVTYCLCEGELCNETWEKAGWNGSSGIDTVDVEESEYARKNNSSSDGSSASSMCISTLGVIFYIASLFFVD